VGQPAGVNPTAYYAEKSGARYVVTGTYFQQAGALVVQAEVTDVVAGGLVASVGPVRGPVGDLMAAAQAGSEQILVALARILDPAAAPPKLTAPPTSFAAYRDFMDGMAEWVEGNRARALELFYRALEADSTYPEALIMASTTEWNLGDIPKGDSIIRVAQRYRNGMAPWDLANLDWLQGWFDGDREAVYRAGRRWAELDPVRGGDCRGARFANRLAEAVADCLKRYDQFYDKAGMLGFFWDDLLTSLHLLGRHETELEYARTARRHNPGAQLAFTFEVRALAALNRVDELRSVLDEARAHGTAFSVGFVIREAGLELQVHGQAALGDSLIRESVAWYREHDEVNTGTAWSLFASGDYAGTRALCERQLSQTPDNATYLGLLGSAAAAVGDRRAALEAGERLVALEQRPYVFGGPAFWHALIVAQLGDRDEAVRLLQVAYEAGAGYGIGLHNAPQLAALRGYPPFERFIAPKD
jgi:tetratricopeptide (TPR) repeat protein